MNITYVLVAAALLALGGVLRIGLTRYRDRARPRDLTGELVPLDVEAFRNLADPSEDEYLRRHLPPRDYRRVARARLRAMAAYVRLASHNAAILAEIGQAASSHSDPQRAAAARAMSNNAFRLRRNSSVALSRIYVAMVWPGVGSPLAPFQEQYLKVVTSAMLYGRLQDPANASRFSVASQ